MKKLFNILQFLLFSCFALYAKNLVPYNDVEINNDLGTANKNWNIGHFNEIYVDGVNDTQKLAEKRIYSINGMSNASISIISEQGITISNLIENSAISINLDESLIIDDPDIGTNRVYFSNLNSDQNYSRVWQSPKTGKIGVWMWGGAGGGGTGNEYYYGGLGGFTYATINVTAGEWFTIVVGGGGEVTRGVNPYYEGTNLIKVAVTSPGGWPNGGYGSVNQGANYISGGGGGRSQLLNGYFTDITNIQETLIIAGGGGGRGNNRWGGDGGGLRGQDSSIPASYGGQFGDQIKGGYFGGGLLQGGNVPNGGGRGSGGGGDGYYGGGGSLLGDTSLGIGGGGGSGYVAETNKIVFGATYLKNATGGSGKSEPIGLDLQEYIIGHGVSNNDEQRANGGLVVIGY